FGTPIEPDHARFWITENAAYRRFRSKTREAVCIPQSQRSLRRSCHPSRMPNQNPRRNPRSLGMHSFLGPSDPKFAHSIPRRPQIPIVFVGVSDPVGSGHVASFARPGGNITGFTLYEPSLAGKWLGTLKEIAPALARVVLMTNPDTATLRGRLYSQAFETAAASFAVKPLAVTVRSGEDVDAAMISLGQEANTGLIVAPDTFTESHSDHIVSLAARHRVPAIYGLRHFPKSGGLVSYGPDTVDTFRRAASYIDRVLRGEKPAELPV